jgi:hypothetical protein
MVRVGWSVILPWAAYNDNSLTAKDAKDAKENDRKRCRRHGKCGGLQSQPGVGQRLSLGTAQYVVIAFAESGFPWRPWR